MPKSRNIGREPRPSEPASYEVGYRKPPVTSRFKTGQSGNPKGRPKGARNKLPALNEQRLKTIILKEAYRPIKVTEGKRQVTISMAEAVIRALAVNAVRGQHRAQKLFAEVVSETERANFALWADSIKAATEYKAGWEQEIERCKELGIPPPDPVPHPDHMTIDSNTGRVIIKGPKSKEEKAIWDRLRDRIKEWDRDIEELLAELKPLKLKKDRKFFQDEILYLTRMRDRAAEIIGEPKKERLNSFLCRLNSASMSPSASRAKAGQEIK